MIGFVLLLVAALGVAPASAVPGSETFGFETGFDDWQPATDGRAAGWEVTRSTERPHTGSHAVRMVINGGNDDGTVWVQRLCDTESMVSVKVTVSFWMWTQGASTFSAWPVVGYVGEQPPRLESDFAKFARTDKPGWQLYSYTTTVNTFSGSVWVAVGLSVTWEITRSSFIDDITVTIEPPF